MQLYPSTTDAGANETCLEAGPNEYRLPVARLLTADQGVSTINHFHDLRQETTDIAANRRAF